LPRGSVDAKRDPFRRGGVVRQLEKGLESVRLRRNRTEIEGFIGFFVNTLVMRTDTSGNPVFRELLKQVRKSTLDAYAHQDLPFEETDNGAQAGTDLSRNPIFQVMFALQNVPHSN
jgi:non-ribosomal peptide synthetase component F